MSRQEELFASKAPRKRGSLAAKAHAKAKAQEQRKAGAYSQRLLGLLRTDPKETR